MNCMSRKGQKNHCQRDHGRKEDDEVNAMKDFLKEKNVPAEDIFMDPAGSALMIAFIAPETFFK